MAFVPLVLMLLFQASADQIIAPRAIDPGSWIGSDDYPVDALRAGTEGQVRFRLTIDPEGRTTGCTIVESGGATFDAATCRLLRERARFEPARNSAGTAMASTHSSSIAWRIPEDRPTPVPFAPAQLIAESLWPARGSGFCRVIEHGLLPETVPIVGCAPMADATKPPKGPHYRTQLVTTLLPDDEDPDFLGLVHGRFHYQTRLRLEVDGSGAVVRCELIGRIGGGSRAREEAEEQCSKLTARGMPVFLPAGPDAPLRKGVLEYGNTSSEVD